MPDSNEIADNFWDDEETGSNIITGEQDQTKIEEQIPLIEKDQKTIEKTETIDDVFADEEDGETEVTEVQKEKGETEEDEDVPVSKLLKSLKQSGFLDIEDDLEITDENASELLETKFEETLDKKLEEVLSELPEEVKEFNKFVLNGGDPSAFFKASKPVESLGSLDLEDEGNQIRMAKLALQEDGFDDEYIEAQIDFLKESKQLKKFSEKRQEVYKKKDNEEKQRLFEMQQQRVAEEKESIKKMKSSISEIIGKEEPLKGLFTVSAKEKKELPSYIADKNIKLEGGGRISEFQKGLLESLKDPEKLTLIAKLVKNDFDFTEIVNRSKTEVTKKVKENVRRGSKTSTETKSILDYFK